MSCTNLLVHNEMASVKKKTKKKLITISYIDACTHTERQALYSCYSVTVLFLRGASVEFSSILNQSCLQDYGRFKSDSEPSYP